LSNTSDDDFLKAIATADFCPYYKDRQKQKVGYFIYSLKQVMGVDWVGDVITKLGDTNATLPNFQKRTISKLKNAMDGIISVNSAGRQYKVDTKTVYTDKTTDTPYYRATK
jgi:hypothetical protein